MEGTRHVSCFEQTALTSPTARPLSRGAAPAAFSRAHQGASARGPNTKPCLSQTLEIAEPAASAGVKVIKACDPSGDVSVEKADEKKGRRLGGGPREDVARRGDNEAKLVRY